MKAPTEYTITIEFKDGQKSRMSCAGKASTCNEFREDLADALRAFVRSARDNSVFPTNDNPNTREESK